MLDPKKYSGYFSVNHDTRLYMLFLCDESEGEHIKVMCGAVPSLDDNSFFKNYSWTLMKEKSQKDFFRFLYLGSKMRKELSININFDIIDYPTLADFIKWAAENL